MTTKIYDADQVTVAILGIPMKGYADGDFLTIERDTPVFSDVVGTDGEVTRSKTNDRRAKVTLRLMQTSSSNDLLSAAVNADENAPNGAGIGAFLVRDRSGRALHTASECWISEVPSRGFGREAKEREWVIRVADLKSFDGGN